MKRTLASALLAVSLASPAAAQVVSAGTYCVEGTNFDGSSYSGTATITLESDTTCSIEWKTGDTTSQGFCMLNGSAFAAGYVLGDDIGLVVYEVKRDGVLDGAWTIAGKNGSGTEVLKLQK